MVLTIRITASHDFANPETVDHICQFASHEQSSHAHSSIPCTPWSRFQALNAAMSSNVRKYKQRLGRQRAASRKLVANVQQVFDVISGSKTFEWPSTANDGWTDIRCFFGGGHTFAMPGACFFLCLWIFTSQRKPFWKEVSFQMF